MSESTNAQIVAELTRVRCLFQARALATIIHDSPVAECKLANGARIVPLSGASATLSETQP